MKVTHLRLSSALPDYKLAEGIKMVHQPGVAGHRAGALWDDKIADGVKINICR
jgi:hypothetical protein